MTTTYHQFKIAQLRQKNLQTTLESIAVFVACFFALAILPQLLIQFVFASEQLFEQPPVFQYMPVVAFVIGAGYFLYAVIMNSLREIQARKLEKELFANSWSATETEASSVEALKAAMTDLETATSKPAKSTKSKKKTRRSSK